MFVTVALLNNSTNHQQRRTQDFSMDRARQLTTYHVRHKFEKIM